MFTLSRTWHIATGILILLVGFCFHWIGQLVSLINWDYATEVGLQERGLVPEYKVYEHAVAVTDVAIGWIYGVAGIGLLSGVAWGTKLAWFPGVVLPYHAISFWAWTANRRSAGQQLISDEMRIGWIIMNVVTGGLALLVAWSAC